MSHRSVHLDGREFIILRRINTDMNLPTPGFVLGTSVLHFLLVVITVAWSKMYSGIRTRVIILIQTSTRKIQKKIKY